MSKEYVQSHFTPLRELQRDATTYTPSIGDKCRKAYERDFGPYDGDISGETGFAALELEQEETNK